MFVRQDQFEFNKKSEEALALTYYFISIYLNLSVCYFHLLLLSLASRQKLSTYVIVYVKIVKLHLINKLGAYTMFHILNPKYNELSEQNFKETIDEIWDFVDTNNNHILSNPQNKIKGNRPLITKKRLTDMMEMEWIPLQEEINFSNYLYLVIKNMESKINKSSQINQEQIKQIKKELVNLLITINHDWVNWRAMTCDTIEPSEEVINRMRAYIEKRLDVEQQEIMRSTYPAPSNIQSGDWMHRLTILYRWTTALENLGMIDDIQARGLVDEEKLGELTIALYRQEYWEKDILCEDEAKKLREMGNTDIEIYKIMGGLSIYKEYLNLSDARYPMKEIREKLLGH